MKKEQGQREEQKLVFSRHSNRNKIYGVLKEKEKPKDRS